MIKEPLRIANCSGFYGDRLSAAREMVEGGPIDILTGDYLAELTMLILRRTQMKDRKLGYAKSFLKQMEEVLGTCLEKKIRVVTNAGGLNPRSLALELKALNEKLGLDAKIAWIEGDDIMARLKELQQQGHDLTNIDTGESFSTVKGIPLTANAYLGAWGIVDALAAGADMVVCPRITDASLVVGPAAWHFGWERTDWDKLAGAVVAGHIIECGTQCTGGNYSFFTEVPSLKRPGFPIAEMHADGSSVITKHEGTDGLVSVETVTGQLLYESGGARYYNPDVVARFDTIRLEPEGKDRVRVSGVKGEPAPPTLKVGINYLGGFRNVINVALTGLNIEKKAEVFKEALLDRIGDFQQMDIRLVRSDNEDAETNEEATAYLRIAVRDADEKKVGRGFFAAVVELALANFPGFYSGQMADKAQPCAVFWPALIPAEVIEHKVILPDESERVVPHTKSRGDGDVQVPVWTPPSIPAGPVKHAPLGEIYGAASGDKGGNANVGVYARSDEAYAWLAANLTTQKLKDLVKEAAGLEVERTELPNIRAINFVIKGILGQGVASSVRPDPQAKSLGEYLRSRKVDLPEALLK